MAKEGASNNQWGDIDRRSKPFLLQRCASSKIHVIDDQNTRD